MTISNDKLYKRLDRKASAIVTKLQNQINNGDVYENQGQKELRQYRDEVNGYFKELTYPERFQLTEMLSISIDNLRY